MKTNIKRFATVNVTMSIRNFFQPSSKRNRDEDDRRDDRNVRHNDENDNRNDDRNNDRNGGRNDGRNGGRNDGRNGGRNDDRNDNRNDDRNGGRNDDHQENRDGDRQENPNFVRDPYRSIPLEEKRKLYRCGTGYLEPEVLPHWPALFKVNKPRIKMAIERNNDKDKWLKQNAFNSNNNINMKVSLWQGDITELEIDCIVNAANEQCLGGGGVDGSIHKAAGPTLRKECELLYGCRTGEAKLTSGHKLPAKHVIHTVGPRGRHPDKLKSCYENTLKIALDNNMRTIAFCCIATGVYGYPNRDAAHVALLAARNFLERHNDSMKRITFCTYLSQDFEIYQELMAKLYFPVSDDEPKVPPPNTRVPVESEVPRNTRVPVESEDPLDTEVPVESEDSSKAFKSIKVPSESDETQDSLPALNQSEECDPKLALGSLNNCGKTCDIQNLPSSSDSLPSIDYNAHDPKRTFEAQESVFESPTESSESNHAVDTDPNERACEQEMEFGSQQGDDMDIGSQQNNDMDMGSQQP